METLSHKAPAHACAHSQTTPRPSVSPRPDAGPTCMCSMCATEPEAEEGPWGRCNDTHRSVVIATWTPSSGMPARHPRRLPAQR